MTAYTAHLRVGAHSWDIDSADPADYGPTLPIRFGWSARQDDGWPTQHEPTRLTFGVIVAAGTDFDDVDLGAVVHFTFTPTGYASPLVTFGGTVRDLVGAPHRLGMLYTMTCIDHLVKLKEDYDTIYSNPDGASVDTVWPLLISGTTPALPDPLFGLAKPGDGDGGFIFGPDAFIGTTWELLTSRAGVAPRATALTPYYQRAVFTYQLDAGGNLLASRPFIGTWAQHGPANAPQHLVSGSGGWTVGGGNVDGSLLPTASAVWARLREEPNVAVSGASVATRTHTGPDIVRVIEGESSSSFGGTYNYWVVNGIEGADQWSSELVFRAWEAPTVVADWFTLPLAMRQLVACHDIDPRHTPSGDGTYVGMLGGASLTIPPGGEWFVSFKLRRTLPTTSGDIGDGTPPAGALAWDDVNPAIAWDDLDPDLTWDDLTTVGP